MVERLHRRFLDVVRAELEHLAIGDITSVQALVLFNIGEKELSLGELTSGGYYLGTNVAQNVQKLAESGYLIHERSHLDRRSNRVRLSGKGRDLYEALITMFEQHIAYLEASPTTEEELEGTVRLLRHLDGFWEQLLCLDQGSPVNISTD